MHEELGGWGKFLLNVNPLMPSLAGRLIISKETKVLEQKPGSGWFQGVGGSREWGWVGEKNSRKKEKEDGKWGLLGPCKDLEFSLRWESLEGYKSKE